MEALIEVAKKKISAKDEEMKGSNWFLGAPTSNVRKREQRRRINIAKMFAHVTLKAFSRMGLFETVIKDLSLGETQNIITRAPNEIMVDANAMYFT